MALALNILGVFALLAVLACQVMMVLFQRERRRDFRALRNDLVDIQRFLDELVKETVRRP